MDLTEENGPTEYFPGTHVFGCSCDEAAKTSFTVRAGSAILFDYRVLHRGLANESAESRPMLYFTYARSWFRDATNYSSVALVDDEQEEATKKKDQATAISPALSRGQAPVVTAAVEIPEVVVEDID